MAATDPVEHIRTIEHETPLAHDLPAKLGALAALPPSLMAPYLTICLDWRPLGDEPGRIPPPPLKRSQRRSLRNRTGISRRPARTEIERQLAQIRERFKSQETALASVESDIDRLNTYLDNELGPAAHGVFVVACHQQGIFIPIPLDVPVLTGVVAGNIPSLRQLVHATEDYPPYAVLVADQRQASLWMIERLTWERAIELDATDFPHKQKQGGWSQRRYQARADERVEHVAKAVAEETRRAFDESGDGLQYLVIAADEPIYSALQEEFHKTVKERIIGRVHLEIDAGLKEIIEEAEPVVEKAERQREREAVQAVLDGSGAGDKGAAGPEATLLALEAGEVLTLVMNEDFAQEGWADYTLPVFGVGEPPREHPSGGKVANIVPTALEDEFIRLALQTDAEVELVWTEMPISGEELDDIPDANEPRPRTEAAQELDQEGGVGATFRFALEVDSLLDETPSTSGNASNTGNA
jgi:Bacterial archaeo-eukaryotic release factor family 10